MQMQEHKIVIGSGFLLYRTCSVLELIKSKAIWLN
jgi:hypothetical protein